MNRTTFFQIAFACLIGLTLARPVSVQAQESLLPIGDGSTLVCVLDLEYGNFIGKWIAGSDYKLIRLKKARRYARRNKNRIRQKLSQASRKGNNIAFLTYTDLLSVWKKTLRDVNRCWFGEGIFTPDQSVGVVPIGPSDVDACAVAGDSAAASLRIINGTVCKVGDSPVVLVDMFATSGKSAGSCSGTVVAPNVVVTAAHCVEGNVSSVRIETSFGGFNSSQIVVHPGYNKGGAFESHDVAIIKTSAALPTREVKLISSNNLVDGEVGVIAGFGYDERGRLGTLRAAPVRVEDAYREGIKILYSGSGVNGNTCSGDSGGPLFVARGNNWVLAGTTSWGQKPNCGPGDQSYFSNISDSLDWIAQVAPEAFF